MCTKCMPSTSWLVSNKMAWVHTLSFDLFLTVLPSPIFLTSCTTSAKTSSWLCTTEFPMSVFKFSFVCVLEDSFVAYNKSDLLEMWQSSDDSANFSQPPFCFMCTCEHPLIVCVYSSSDFVLFDLWFSFTCIVLGLLNPAWFKTNWWWELIGIRQIIIVRKFCTLWYIF